MRLEGIARFLAIHSGMQDNTQTEAQLLSRIRHLIAQIRTTLVDARLSEAQFRRAVVRAKRCRKCSKKVAIRKRASRVELAVTGRHVC